MFTGTRSPGAVIISWRRDGQPAPAAVLRAAQLRHDPLAPRRAGRAGATFSPARASCAV